MTAENFCFWLQGFFELSAVNSVGDSPLAAAQGNTIKRHLALVFAHDIDPKAGDAKEQAKLNAIHSPFGTDVKARC